MSDLHWQKSTYSPDASNCVYVAAPAPDAIHLRESDEPQIILTTTRDPLSALIRTLKTNPSRRRA
ncbi:MULTISPECIES: DUF397 domain-containing protein [Streptomyces]|uniref:DUF397 domain-containing protein n=1 Tax=Streptomyces dengpaensis TaxID=2049881 RepID=A0ABM6SUR5_9ACTN|nr:MULTISPECIES: DUF397 domain-containing protein [Streptomyces]AVH58463.1 DUF397 domain-containing protein [Streptomyces dengpaensis]PIB06134.1 DUF397 domain-containing protein [Streptomyces sp. HG99]